MADLSDVEKTLVALVAAGVYPSGTNAPSAITLNSNPVPCVVHRGWPNKTQLDADLKAGRAVVSVWSPPGGQRITTRDPTDWVDLSYYTPTISLAIGGTTIALSGFPQVPQNVAVIINGVGVVYAVQNNDTIEQVAAALATLINEITPASSVGAVITIPGAHSIEGASGGQGTVQRVLRQQEQMISLMVWTPTPEMRDAATSYVDLLLAGKGLANRREFLSMPDGSVARIEYRSTASYDTAELQGVFRRDLRFSIEYAMTETVAATQILQVQIDGDVTAGDGEDVSDFSNVS